MILPDHHAILIDNDPSTTVTLLRDELKFKDNDPDIIWTSFESIGIDEARSIIELALTAPINKAKKKIIISAGSITREAQNGLLKLFEDPNPQVEFIIAFENAHSLLPTLRSRLLVVKGIRTGAVIGPDPIEFLGLSLSSKMTEVDRIVARFKDSGSRQEARRFLQTLLTELECDPKANLDGIRAIGSALSYIDDKGASLKLLLESVALSV